MKNLKEKVLIHKEVICVVNVANPPYYEQGIYVFVEDFILKAVYV